MKIIYIILGSLFAIFLLSGCVSLRFFDPQYYKFKYLAHKEGGIYIVNERMYEILIKKQGNITFVVDRIEFTESTNYSRIESVVDLRYCFLDESNQEAKTCDNKHLVLYRKAFVYQNPGFWITGDEGRGFQIDLHNPLIYNNEQKFTSKDGKWTKVER